LLLALGCASFDDASADGAYVYYSVTDAGAQTDAPPPSDSGQPADGGMPVDSGSGQPDGGSGQSDGGALPTGPQFYVGPAATGTGDGSLGNPWNIDQALKLAGPGDTVLFLDGVYRQPLLFTRSGEQDAPIVFRAAPGALPVLDGDGVGNRPGMTSLAVVHDLVVEGFFVRNWRYAGIGFTWDHHGCKNITIRHCVADSNQLAGIGAYFAEGITIEHNIASRNGWGPESWTSNFTIYTIGGTNNVVRGNVAFHGIDTSSHQSDGNGFILDVSTNAGNALFENNLAFLNGGAGFASTDSSGARFVGNTSFHNGQAILKLAEFAFVDTCRDESPINGQRYALNNVVLRNNVGVAQSGRLAETRYSCGDKNPTFLNSDLRNNHFATGDASGLFSNAAALDFRPTMGSALQGTADATGTLNQDLGFDPKCIKPESGQRYTWWRFAPDEAYIRSIGGVAACFSPISRPRGDGQEIGAYEIR
jgi:hypothetical protein